MVDTKSASSNIIPSECPMHADYVKPVAPPSECPMHADYVKPVTPPSECPMHAGGSTTSEAPLDPANMVRLKVYCFLGHSCSHALSSFS